jgi:hypothetical protein
MKILFHTGVICYRGSTVAIEDYARYNQSLLGNESIIVYDKHHVANQPEVIANMGKEFNLIPIDNLSELQAIIDREKVDLLYNGEGFVPTNCPVVGHEAWQLDSYKPYMKSYAYISEWLANDMNSKLGTDYPYVPHVVQLPEPTGDFKELFGIKPGQTVIGRHGGQQEFNLPFVKQSIANIVNKRDDFVFVFVGTDPWIDHPNVRFTQAFHNLQTKANFINTCDAMIHARANGESFGLAMSEFLSLNKPVLVWEAGNDRNHAWIMRDSGLIYNTENVEEKILSIGDYIGAEDWTQRVAEFRPQPVMEKFSKIFLQ